MYATLTVRDETVFNPGVFDDAAFALTLKFPTERITVRELIRARVRHEVHEYNTSLPEYFRGLVEPADAERTLNGYKLKQRRLVDWEQQLDKAIKAFQSNGFIILVDERQAGDLDEVIEIKPDTSVTFLKLVPLVGG
jgi:hypothetical protein